MRLYRALLHLYPASFRGEYGEEMCAIFAQRRRDAPHALAVLALWAETCFEVLRNAAHVHADILGQDLRYTVRTLGRAPGFTLTAILVVALGVGATTAVFSVTDRVLIRPLPFPDSNRLVKLWEGQPGYRNELSPANYRDWKRMSKAFEAMAAYRRLSANLVGQGDPQRIEGASATADLFPMLGVQPVLGRLFTAEDDREGAPGTVLLSYSLWQAAFGGDAAVLGRKVLLDGAPHVIIGVMPRGFHFPSRDAGLWTPMRFAERDFEDRNDTYLYAVAKLRPGASLEQARAEMGVVTAQLARQYPKENAGIGAIVNRLRDEVSEQSRLLLAALCGAALCVLLIACSNLANLLLARALARRKELAVRAALGAGRERLARQLMTESSVLAALGGALGVLVAVAAVPLLATLVPSSLPITDAPSIDLRVMVFAALLTGMTGMAFGVLPALRACGQMDPSGLREGARAGAGGRKERLRSALVVAEVTASVVLLISAGLLIRALWQLQAVDPGFRTEGVLTLRTALPLPKYEKVAQRREFYTRVLSDVQALPGVSSAAYISGLPMMMRGGIWGVSVEGRPESRAEARGASMRYATPGFFKAMGIPLLMGRDISEADAQNSPYVAVVSESFVRHYWPGENPLGRRFKFALHDRTLVGVVGDIRVRGLERSSEPQVYLSYQQVPDGWIIGYTPKDLVIRSSGDPATLVPAIRRIIRSADPEQAVSDVRMLAEIVDGETAPRFVQVRALGAFAAIAFLLAGIGLYGLLSFAVSQRAQEIGIRIALGAQSADILTMVMRQGVRLAAAGIVLGVALGYAAGRGVEALLAGVKPWDPASFLAAVGLSFLMTMAGSLVPGLRAVRVDPVTAIRAE